jgi:hypothetical protein
VRCKAAKRERFNRTGLRCACCPAVYCSGQKLHLCPGLPPIPLYSSSLYPSAEHRLYPLLRCKGLRLSNDLGRPRYSLLSFCATANVTRKRSPMQRNSKADPTAGRASLSAPRNALDCCSPTASATSFASCGCTRSYVPVPTLCGDERMRLQIYTTPDAVQLIKPLAVRQPNLIRRRC